MPCIVDIREVRRVRLVHVYHVACKALYEDMHRAEGVRGSVPLLKPASGAPK